jgi:hypothetical protein
MILHYMLDYTAALTAYYTCYSIDKRMYDSKRLFSELVNYIVHCNKVIAEQLLYIKNNHTHLLSYFNTATATSTSLKHLVKGVNTNTVLTLIILAETIYSVPPHNYICCDATGALVMVCFYNMADKIHYFKKYQRLVIQSPLLYDKSAVNTSTSSTVSTSASPVAEWPALRQDISIIQIFDLSCVTVDNKCIPHDLIVPTVLKAILLNDDIIGKAL